MESVIEKTYTVDDYYDGPITGIAAYKGEPHHYQRIFDEDEDEWSDIYWLTAIDAETFKLALEKWQMWLRWRTAYDNGETTIATHPALHEDKERYETIKQLLDEKIKIDMTTAYKARAKFYSRDGKSLSSSNDILVEWAPMKEGDEIRDWVP